MSIRRRLPSTPSIVLIGCVALSCVSLLSSAMPHYDAWGWIVWGREIFDPNRDLGTLGGPAWKPLPVLFTTVLAPLGSAAADGWLVVARAGGLLAVALAFALGRRFGGKLAGTIAAAGLLLSHAWILYIAWGSSDPLLVAAVLGAVLLHLEGRPGGALAAGLAAALLRPEVWPFFGLYALWLWRGRIVRRPLVAGTLLLLPILWLGPDWYSTGDPFTGSHLASDSLEAKAAQRAASPFLASLGHTFALVPSPVWILALVGAGVALRARNRALLGLAAGCSAWIALVALMTVGGYAGLGRFALVAAAIACVLAGRGAGDVLSMARSPRSRAAVRLILVAAVALPVAVGLRSAAADVGSAGGGRSVLAALHQVIVRAGGAARVRSWGPPIINGGMVTALAWQLGVPIRQVTDKPRTASFVLFRASAGVYSGPRPQCRCARAREVSRAAPWVLLRETTR